MDHRTLKIGIAGAGHFGRFHAQKIAASARSVLAGIADRDPARAAQVAAETGTTAMAWSDLLAASDAIVVATPAESHFDLASQALRAGKHVLVEKPVAATLAEADALAGLAQQAGLVLQVGHLLRFTPEHAAIQLHMPRPIFIECIRIAPFKPRGTDVSVVLDLMIHDLDMVLSLVDAELETVDAIGAPVASEFEDIANARLGFSNGCVAMITASRISLRTERKMRLFGQDGYLNVDFAARSLMAIGRGGDGMPVPGMPAATMRHITWPEQDALAAEHAGFVAAVLDGAPIRVDAAAGRRALAAALAVADRMKAARVRAEASGLIR